MFFFFSIEYVGGGAGGYVNVRDWSENCQHVEMIYLAVI